MNKLFRFIFLISFYVLQAQGIQLSANNTGWIPVSSYNGANMKNLANIFIQAQNSQGWQMSEWSLGFRVVGEISNGQQKFPAEKLKFKFSNVSSNGPNEDNVIPTSSTLLLNTGILPFSNMNTFFVNGSPFSLQSKRYFNMNLLYDVIVDGGSYLSDYRSWSNYNINLEIEIRNRKQELVALSPLRFEMQVYPTDLPPNSPTYGIQFDPAAKNILLEFKTPGDYANGVSKSFSKAFATFSNTPYEVQVNALGNNLTSPGNRTLPVSAIRLTIKEFTTQIQSGSVQPSSSPQTIITSPAHSSSKFFDAIYSTQAGDTTFFNKAYEQYSGTLIFTMLPR